MQIQRLDEVSTSRLAKRFSDATKSFAIVSGCRPDEDRTRELKIRIRDLGYGFTEFIGRWVEDGINYDENSLLINDIPFKKAFELGQEFNQSSIIYKDKDGCREICTAPFETFNVGDVVRTFRIDANKPLNVELAQEIFSNRRGGGASKPIKGSNAKPFTFKEKFELYEKVLVNTWHGFTESKINL